MMGPTEPIASGVIAYNGDSERGWNDPPTLSFNTVTSSKKGPKLDLRKRVSHHEALTGRKVSSPLTQNPPNLYQQGNNVTDGLSHLTLNKKPLTQPAPSNIPPASPCHSRHSSGTYTPPLLPDTKAYGVVPPQYPTQCHSFGQNNSQTQMSYGNMVQVPPTTNLSTTVAPPQLFSPVSAPLQSDGGIVHPLAQKSSTTTPTQLLPVTTAPPSNLGKPLFSFPSSFNMVPISSALDTSHVRSNPIISPETSPQKDVNDQIPSFQRTNMATHGPLIFTPSPTSADSGTSLPLRTVQKRSPILNRAYPNGNSPKMYTPPPLNSSGRNSPIVSPPQAPVINRSSPVSTPTGTHSHSASGSPRSSTPENGHLSEHTSRHNSEDFNSEEGMEVTIEAIEETIIKCTNILKAREIDDVKKKVETMKQLWVDGKLSLPVQITMKLLSQVLLEGDTETAHKLHLKLMVDYVGEVKQWMVAIKRLISAIRSISNPVS